MKSPKIIIIIIIIIFISAFLIWLYLASTKPLPGTEALQEGRDHLAEGTKIDYQFNPPTSGNHYASWISKGFYGEPRADGNLIHSLEHGYIIFWYDCDRKVTSYMQQGIVGTAYAQASNMTAGSEGSVSAKLSDMPPSFSDGSCDNFKNQIKNQIQKNNPHKIIAIPRIGMDSPLILTAWGRMEKLNSIDEQKIKEFIDAFRDNGPERTVED